MSKPTSDRAAISRIIDGLTERGLTMVETIDGAGDHLAYTDKKSALDWVTSCDDGHLYVRIPGDPRPKFIYFVLGNDPEEVVCDHHVDLSQFIDPIVEPWWK